MPERIVSTCGWSNVMYRTNVLSLEEGTRRCRHKPHPRLHLLYLILSLEVGDGGSHVFSDLGYFAFG